MNATWKNWDLLSSKSQDEIVRYFKEQAAKDEKREKFEIELHRFCSREITEEEFRKRIGL